MKARILRIQVAAPLARLLIAHSLPRFIQSRPGLRIHLTEFDSTAAAPGLARDTDAAICIGPVPDTHLRTQRIGTVRSVTCASPDFIDRHGNPRVPGELQPGSCIGILASDGSAREWVFRSGRAKHAISPAAPVAFGDSALAIAAAVRGGGYVRVPGIEVDREIGAGLLEPVLADWSDASAVSIAWAAEVPASNDLSAFAAFVARLFPIEQAEGTPLKASRPYFSTIGTGLGPAWST